ncbi:MAG: hypothetical protein HFE63_03360 [Clostridiales bacterium]|nr:hypothetical protein [Clostridiales bacterium]
MNFKRITALLLLSALLSAVSCGDNSTTDDTNQTDSNDIDSVETTNAIDARKAVSDDLPERDFEGKEFTILTYDQLLTDSFVEGETGDLINDAVYNRNRAVEERFKCKIGAISYANYDDTTSHVKRSVLANDNDFSLISYHVVAFSGIVMDDLLMNWYDLDYINFSKPWWSRSNTEDLTYGDDKAILAVGDFSLSSLSGAYCYFFDKKESENYNLGNLYEVVNDGKWTIDYVMNITKDIYRDINGNGERDAFDFYGVTHQLGSALNTYLWSSGNHVISKNSSGEFEITFKNERTNTIIEKVYQLCYESEGVCTDRKVLYPEDAPGYHYTGALSFRDNLCVFAPGTMDMTINYFREKTNEYGILPYPKLDESQDDYYTMVDGYHSALGVPKTIDDPEFVGIITEALNAETYKSVYPAYYEVALKTKYTYDDESVAILDKLVENRVFDFGYIYDNWKGMAFYIQNIIGTEKSSNFESYYAKNSTSAITYYNKLFDYFENME